MRRLLRWAFNSAAAVSLLLFVVTCVLWVRSEVEMDWWSLPLAWPSIAVESDPGLFAFTLTPERNPRRVWEHSSYRFPDRRERERDDPTAPDWRLAGFRFRGGDFTDGGTLVSHWWFIHVPLWLVSTLLLIFPAHRHLRFLQTRRRVGKNACPGCGYDMRATPDRCPECGAVRTEKQGLPPREPGNVTRKLPSAVENSGRRATKTLTIAGEGQAGVLGFEDTSESGKTPKNQGISQPGGVKASPTVSVPMAQFGCSAPR